MKFNLPKAENHKGQNGKVLIVGGSRLFHAASLWSAQMAAHLVDMVFYASVSENNQVLREGKKKFFDGIVIGRGDLAAYAAEAEVILLGPGLARGEWKRERLREVLASGGKLSENEWEESSYLVTNYILHQYGQLAGKKLVLDAGSLQMLDLEYLPPGAILTPHRGEWQGLQKQARERGWTEKLKEAVILEKGRVDKIWRGGEIVAQVSGGNAGLTKGGSGDVLAGLVAGLYCYNSNVDACELASRALKGAGDGLFARVGPFFTTTQLLGKIPECLWQLRAPARNQEGSDEARQ